MSSSSIRSNSLRYALIDFKVCGVVLGLAEDVLLEDESAHACGTDVPHILQVGNSLVKVASDLSVVIFIVKVLLKSFVILVAVSGVNRLEHLVELYQVDIPAVEHHELQ